MLPKKNRLTKKEGEFIFRKGKSYKEGFLLLKIIKKKEKTPPAFAVIVPNKISKKAVERNRIKRKIREALRKNLPDIKEETRGILIALSDILGKDYWEIEKNIKKIIEISGIEK